MVTTQHASAHLSSAGVSCDIPVVPLKFAVAAVLAVVNRTFHLNGFAAAITPSGAGGCR
jgi:hypothetical protein